MLSITTKSIDRLKVSALVWKLAAGSAFTLIPYSLANPTKFEEVPPKESGVHFQHPLEKDHPMAFLYDTGTAVGGICLGDVNGDDISDLYLVGGPNQNQLYWGSPDIKFTQSPSDIIGGGDRWGTGANLVDIDNDGDLDLYQCNYGTENQLFINDGTGNFSELQGAGGLNVNDASLGAFFADIDNDGDLDCFILCNRFYNPEGRPSKPPYDIVYGEPVIKKEYERYYHITVKPNGEKHLDAYGRRDYLLLNEGNTPDGSPRFRDISEPSGLAQKGSGLSAIWWDYDMDGDQDLYVANDHTDNDRLFRNDGLNESGTPVFTDVIGDTLPTITWSSMGSDAADYNNDGMPDLFAVDMSATTHFKAKSSMGEITELNRLIMTHGWPRQAMRNHLFTNTGMGMFSEQAFASGIASTDWSWSAKFGDLDNDGWLDLFVTNGVARNFTNPDMVQPGAEGRDPMIGKTPWDPHKEEPPMPEKNLAFQNLKGKKFKQRDDWGLDLLGMSYSSAMGDLDQDGDLDIIVSDLDGHLRIFRNHSTGHSSIRVRLQGTDSNLMGVGARVIVIDTKGIKRTRWMNPWTGFQSQHDTTLHVGLGSERPSSIEIHWPSGTYQKLDLTPDTKEVQITEKASREAPMHAQKTPRFAEAKAPEFEHRERIFDDFKQQPLIPSKHSQLGPCLAAGDVDLDGDLDFYIGGGNGQTAALFINNGGSFEQSPQPAFEGLAKYADETAATWFDADGDGDIDLFVVTGGSEFAPDDIIYQDYLYLNESTAEQVRMVRATDDALPQLTDSGSCVVASDYDADGDIDLFVGSRLVPGKYPTPPKNRLLRNDSQNGTLRFTDVTPEQLENIGMVTDASWADLNNDGKPDLALSLDWGPIAIFKNTGDTLIDATPHTQCADQQGWWRSIHIVDVDADGDLDIVAGNAGINTKYKMPSDKKPAMLYYGDMDGSGLPRIVEAKRGKDVHNRERPLPVRGRY